MNTPNDHEYAVVRWNESGIYKKSDVVQTFKSEVVAQKNADKRNEKEGLGREGYVVRSIKYMRNEDKKIFDLFDKMNEWKKKRKKKREDRGRLNLPTQDFPPKLSVSIGQPVGGTDIMHQEGHMSYKVKNLMKEINEVNEEMVSGQGMDDIENLIDKYGLEGICDAISHICGEKADHVRSTWQDEPMAKAWEKNAKLFDALTAKIVSTT